MSTVEDIKTLYDDKASTDKKLEVIEGLTRTRLKRLLKLDVGEKISDDFEDVVTEVTAARFARIGNEGMKSYQQEGLSMTFPDDDFAQYMDEINAYVNGDDYQKPKHGGYFFV